ncbi:hypothetical protein DPX16_21038 [Anabarilius grahami]|uniref:Uncharacterized protein n=1 Tax=Anabarilius grahami TaxID=495550 RepID=A0A3N0YWT5_ANAGA|nr:hypothetical protein DPX16_21038 [Anabarilius grahami]
MSEAGENTQAKLPVSSPVSGREILGLTSWPLTEGGKRALGGGRFILQKYRGDFKLKWLYPHVKGMWVDRVILAGGIERVQGTSSISSIITTPPFDVNCPAAHLPSTVLGDNAAGHVMGARCQGGLSSREQNQRPSAQSGIVVLTINMRAVT